MVQSGFAGEIFGTVAGTGPERLTKGLWEKYPHRYRDVGLWRLIASIDATAFLPVQLFAAD